MSLAALTSQIISSKQFSHFLFIVVHYIDRILSLFCFPFPSSSGSYSLFDDLTHIFIENYSMF